MTFAYSSVLSNSRISKKFRRAFKGKSLLKEEMFAKRIRSTDIILEIGPFTRPNVRSPNVRYFDVMDRIGLLRRAEILDFPRDCPVDIDFVSPNGDLSIVPSEQFDVVLSSHCIEHQPDLISHLRNVWRVLKPGGSYLLVVPDKRYCFDHFFKPSSVSAVIEAHRESRKLHTMANVVSHRTMTTHNDAGRHWAGDHGAPSMLLDPGLENRVIAEYAARTANGEYIDTHAWQFTPASFHRIMWALRFAGIIKLWPRRVYQTPKNMFEFCAILSRG